MSCRNCGAPTPRRYCRTCEYLSYLDEGSEVDREYPECPECGGITSGEGVRCHRCRGGGADV